MALLDSFRKMFGGDSIGDIDDKSDVSYSVAELHLSTQSNDLLDAHNAVETWYLDRMADRERYTDFMTPEGQWTGEEREAAAAKKKAIISFNKMVSLSRTYVGALIQQRYDIKPSPTEPTDQDIADVYAHLYHFTHHTTKCRFKDPGLIRDSWIGGNAWQESYVEITPGDKPRIIVENQNNFAIYPDPNRRDLVGNTDCMFIDRVSWMSTGDLCNAFPDHEDEIKRALAPYTSIDYDPQKVYADRAHESVDYRNGKWKVVERFYKVRRNRWYSDTEEGKEEIGYDLPKSERDEFRKQNPERNLYYAPEEWLYLAVAVPSMEGSFLHNGPYHCQPRDPVTGRILFPIYELVDEDLNGDPRGHAENLVGPQKVINSLAVNKLAAAKNAAGTSHVVNGDHFEEDVLTDISENLSDGSRVFVSKTGKQGAGITPIEMGGGSSDGNQMMDFASSVMQDASSTPPALQGYAESSGTPAALNEQRIQQAHVQSQVQFTNYINFLTTRAKLWMFYYREYFDYEEVIRVLQPRNENDPEWIKINEVVMDEFGRIKRNNGIQDASAYDVTFEDSWQSPTMRDKALRGVEKILNTATAQGDPELNAFLTQYFLELSDAPADLKKMFKERSQVINQAQQRMAELQAQQQQQGLEMGQIKEAQALQQLAETEAEQTFPQVPRQMAAA